MLIWIESHQFVIGGFFHGIKKRPTILLAFIKFLSSFYANKSRTSEGNNPITIFKAIAITATA